MPTLRPSAVVVGLVVALAMALAAAAGTTAGTVAAGAALVPSIVVLWAPSVAARVAAAGGEATEAAERAWSVARSMPSRRCLPGSLAPGPPCGPAIASRGRWTASRQR